MNDENINPQAAAEVTRQVNEATRQNPALEGWEIFTKKTKNGIVGFGVAGPGGAGIPDPMMQVINAALKQNELPGASVVRDF